MPGSVMVAAFWGSFLALISQIVILFMPYVSQIIQLDLQHQFASWAFVLSCFAWIRFFFGVALMSYAISGESLQSNHTISHRTITLCVQISLLVLINVSLSLYESFGHVARIIILICAIVSGGYLIYVAAHSINEVWSHLLGKPSASSSVQPTAQNQQWTGGIWAGSLLADGLILGGISAAIFSGTKDFLQHNPAHGQGVTALFGVFALILGLFFFKMFGRSLKILYDQTTAFITTGTLLDHGTSSLGPSMSGMNPTQ